MSRFNKQIGIFVEGTRVMVPYKFQRILAPRRDLTMLQYLTF